MPRGLDGRGSSADRRRWGSTGCTRSSATSPRTALGVDPEWIAEHAGEIDHFFHLAAIYDMTAADATNETMNVGGTRNALELAGELEAGYFHQVSSVAASGDYPRRFDETMFDEGQHLPSPYHRTKFESEKIVREESTGAVARLPARRSWSATPRPARWTRSTAPTTSSRCSSGCATALPAWLPLVGVDLGDTNVVPVDYVAKAMDHLAHLPDRDGEAFHLVNPEPQPRSS